MKEKINIFLKNPLIAGTSIIFFGSLFGNVFNFFFNFFVSRSLSPSDFGEYTSLVAIILLLALISESFVPTIVYFAGIYFAKNDTDHVTGLIWKFNKYFILLGFIVLIAFIFLKDSIGLFLKTTDNSLIVLVGISLFFSYIGVVNRGTIQAKLEFRFLSFITIIAAVIKFAVGVVLIFLGYRVAGTMWAFVVSFMVSFLLTFFSLKKIMFRKIKDVKISFGDIFSYSKYATFSMLGLTSFITSDLLLVKHFFSLHDAGIYSGMSLLGRIIFFFSSPIATVMFPLVTRRYAKNEKYSHLFLMSLLLVFVSSCFITFFYFMFSELSIKILLNKPDYLVISKDLGFFGIFITLYSILTITTNFFLSVRKTKVVYPIIFGALAQIVLIWMFHSSFLEVVQISIFSVSIPLFVLLVYYWKLYGTGKR